MKIKKIFSEVQNRSLFDLNEDTINGDWTHFYIEDVYNPPKNSDDLYDSDIDVLIIHDKNFYKEELGDSDVVSISGDSILDWLDDYLDDKIDSNQLIDFEYTVDFNDILYDYIRDTYKKVPIKKWKDFTATMKQVYGLDDI